MVEWTCTPIAVYHYQCLVGSVQCAHCSTQNGIEKHWNIATPLNLWAHIFRRRFSLAEKSLCTFLGKASCFGYVAQSLGITMIWYEAYQQTIQMAIYKELYVFQQRKHRYKTVLCVSLSVANMFIKKICIFYWPTFWFKACKANIFLQS